MKFLTKTFLILSSLAAVVLPVLLMAGLVRASGTANVYLSPANTVIAQGATIDVDIHEDSGTDQINAVQANLTYSSNLTFVSVINSPDFGVYAQNSGGGGTVKIGRGNTSPLTGDHIVATVRFTASGSGTATVNFDTGTAVVRSSDNQPESLNPTGASYSITSQSTMTLSPASKTLNPGDSFDVAIYEDSGGDQVNAVQANLSYPSNLTFVSVAPNEAEWPVQAQNSGGGGLVKIGEGVIGNLTGKHLVATVTFKAASAGTASVAFAAGSAIIRSSDNTPEPSLNTGGIYTVNAPSTPPSSGGGGSGSGSGGGTGSSTSASKSKPKSAAVSPPQSVTSAPTQQSSPVTTPLDTTKPVISGVKAVNVTKSSATITWKTSEPADSEVDYGLNKKLILIKLDTKLVTNHSVKLSSKDIVANQTYSFAVKSADAASNQAVSGEMTFYTGNKLVSSKTAVIIGSAVVAGAAVLWVLSGGLKFGSAAASLGGTYTPPKPIILGGGPQPQKVVKPQPAAPPPPAPAAQAPAQNQAPPAKSTTPSAEPGKVIKPVKSKTP